MESQRRKYATKPQISAVLSASALFDLQDRLKAQIDAGVEGAPNVSPLVLYATHDTTMVRLLAGTDLWDGDWPFYSEPLILEAWRKKDQAAKHKGFFRFIRRGKPLR